MLDIIVVLVVAFGFFAGFSRGLVKTVFDTASLFIGILAAMKLSPVVIEVIENMVNISPEISYLLGLVITFILVMAIIRFIGRRVEDVLQAANINIINKLAGGALQGAFFAFCISIAIHTLAKYDVMKPETKTTSVTYPYLEPLPEFGKSLFASAKPIFQDFWRKTDEVLENLGGNITTKAREK